MAKPLERDPTTGALIETNPATAGGVASAGKLVELDAQGRLPASTMPSGIGADLKAFEASEAINAGDFVNIFDDSGTAKIRKADASDATKRAHGFTPANIASGATGEVYFEGENASVSGLTAGATVFLDGATAGGVTAVAPSTAGHISQIIGVATSDTSINVELGQAIQLA